MTDERSRNENGSSASTHRGAAEDQIAKSTGLPPELEDKTSEEIIHELRVAQIELEMQQDELKKTLFALKQSRDQYQDLYDFSPVGYLTLTPKGVVKQVNLSLATLLGVTRRKLVDLGFGHFVDYESLGQFDIHITSVLKQKEKLSCNLRLKREDGSSLYVRLESSRNDGSTEEEETRGILTAVTDITERKRAEENLKNEKDKFRGILHSMNDGVYIVNAAQDIEYINPAIEASFGTVDGRKCYEYFHDLTEPCPWCKNEEVFAGRSVQWEWFSHKTGKTYDLFDTPLRNPDGSISKLEFFHDISDRKVAEEAVQRSEKFLEQVVENIPNMIFVKEAESLRFVRFNKAGEDLLGYSREDLLGRNDYDLFPAAQADFFTAKDRAVLAEGKLFDISEEEISTKNKGKRILHTKKIPIIDADGTTQFLLGISEDITERKQSEEKNLRLAAIVESSDDAIIGKTLDGTITSWNKGAERIYGYKKNEVVGKPITILAPDDREDEILGFLEQIKGGESVKTVETVRRKKDGDTIPVSLTISPIIDKEGDIIGASTIVRDISDRVKAAQERQALQEQLLQAQKMEAVGTLAGGIAHDFNNLLQVVLGYSEVMLLRKQEGEADYVDLHKIYQAGKRGADLVKSLLTFSRKVEAQYVPMDLNQEIAAVRDLLFNTIPKTITIDLHLSENLATIQADRSQISQILMNLGVNARDAMPGGGTLSIETANIKLDEGYCGIHPEVKPGNYVLLTVSDTGQGMDKETLSHIFEPFFTTKEQGKGTGLGLATVYGIVKHHEGCINCNSEVGHGTTFNIYLPTIQTDQILETSPIETTTPGGKETILLVEDDDMIRELCAELLVGVGYNVISAGNGKEALEIFQKDKDRISLILLDLIMPVMDGWQCLAKILRIDPKAKVIIASGYIASGLAKGMQAKGAMGFVQKPFETSQLLTTIRKILDNDIRGPGNTGDRSEIGS